MKLHALVEDLAAARAAVAGGATVVQLRRKGATTDELVEAGAGFRELGVTFVVNDDVAAAIRLGADGVHLGQSDIGADEAPRRASCSDSPRARGAGPPWPSTAARATSAPGRSGRRLEARRGGPIGLVGLAEICQSVPVPVIAIGGIDPTNVADCLAAGATGVAVIRGLARIREPRSSSLRSASSACSPSSRRAG